jgi:pimeloyl-ACP methyl ester carboxylesterase
VTHATLTSQTIVIRDAYDAEGFDFSGTRSFDQGTGYRSRSMLVVPLRDSINRVIGVIQLLNAQDPQTGEVIEFNNGMLQTVESLSSLASAALSVYDREQRLRQQIADLRIEIDTAKRQKAVAEITETDYFQSLSSRVRELRQAPEQQRSNSTRASNDTNRIYEVNGQPIHVHEEGGDNRQLALLIHGWSSSWFALSPLLPIVSRRLRCLCVDLPGYGESPPLAERATIPAYADLLADLIRQQTNQPVVLIGHSMGGMISMTLALRHPQLVERMVLLCPTVSGNLSQLINISIAPITFLEQFSLANRLVAAIEPQVLSLTDRLMRPVSFAERTGIREEVYHRLRADARRPGQGRVRAECFWAMRNHDLSGKIGKIEAPTLVIWGMEDNTVPLRDASIVADEWPDAELRVIPKAGHWPQFETPEPTLRFTRGFLSTPIKLLRTQF